MNEMRQGGPRIRSPQPPPPPPLPPPAPEKIRVHRSEYPDSYLPPGGGGGEVVRKRMPSRPLRSLSPPPPESRRVMIGDRRGKSIERRMDVGAGNVPKWSQFDDGYMRREEHRTTYLIQQPKDMNADARMSHLKHIGEDVDVDSDDGRGRDAFYRRPPPPQDISPPRKIIRNFPSSSSGNFDVRLRNEDVRYVDNLQQRSKVPVPARVLYKQDKDLLYSNDHDTMRVLPRSRAFGGTSSDVLEDEFYGSRERNMVLPSHEFGRKQRKYVGPAGQDGYNELPPPPPPPEFARHSEQDSTFYPEEPISPEHPDYTYSGYARRELGDPEYPSNEDYRKRRPSVQGGYSTRARPSFSGTIISRSEYIESLRESRESGPRNNPLLRGEPGIEYVDNRKNPVAPNRDRVFLNSGSRNVEFRAKVSRERDITHSEDDYGFRGNDGLVSYKERVRRSQMTECDPDTCGIDHSPNRRSRPDELDIYEPPERMLKRKYIVDEEMSMHNANSILLSSRNPPRRVRELSVSDDQWTSEDPGEISISKRLRFPPQQHRKVRRPYDETIASRLSAPDDWISSENVPVHVRRRAIGGYPRGDGIKARLRPCPTSYHESYPFDRRNFVYKPNKTWKRNVDGQHGVVPKDDADYLDDSLATVKPEPPEDSEEFKQLVESSFLRFSKYLNENPVHRRRYKEQGYAGSLFCVVCGSISKEFMDTRSLVTHTFMSRKVGIRSDHLGLHKALCVLMGWTSTVALNGACLYHVLTDAEAFTHKEDLVLWPPVVIIHNSSIGNNNLDERQVVSVEQMESILIDLGFSGGMIKVRKGKPVNQSIMVVKFLPTFSGLQEAERLHKYYTENKRGRKELKQLNFNNINTSKEKAGGTPADTKDLVLYGYMAIAEDLDKLDFDTKKRAVVKSKKDIQAIADAPVKTE